MVFQGKAASYGEGTQCAEDAKGTRFHCPPGQAVSHTRAQEGTEGGTSVGSAGTSVTCQSCEGLGYGAKSRQRHKTREQVPQRRTGDRSVTRPSSQGPHHRDQDRATAPKETRWSCGEDNRVTRALVPQLWRVQSGGRGQRPRGTDSPAEVRAHTGGHRWTTAGATPRDGMGERTPDGGRPGTELQAEKEIWGVKNR